MTVEQLEELKFIAILRHVPVEKTEKVLKALWDGGIRAFEITYDPSDKNTVETVASQFAIAKKLFGDQAHLVAGTVVKTSYVRAAKKAGAEGIVSPNTDRRIVKLTKRLGMMSVPGAFTPSEIVRAYDLGADLVKIFPILPDNIAYLRNVVSPLSHIPFITTGGVNVNTAAELMKTGATALAAGASIITPAALAEEDYDTITENARRHLAAIFG